MKFAFAIILSNFLISYACSQKPAIDTNIINNWPKITGHLLSNNGKYLFYQVETAAPTSQPHLYLSRTDTIQTIDLGIGDNPAFTNDSKYLIFQSRGDTLSIRALGADSLIRIPGVVGYTIPQQNASHFLAYQSAAKQVILFDLSTGRQEFFSSIKSFTFSPLGKWLLLTASSTATLPAKLLLHSLSASASNTATVAQGYSFPQFAFDASETQLVYLTEDTIRNEKNYSLSRYLTEPRQAEILVSDYKHNLPSGTAIKNDRISFTRDAQRVFFSLRELPDPSNSRHPSPAPDIWSYRDQFLQSQQLASIKSQSNRSYKAVVTLDSNSVLRLEFENDGPAGRFSLSHDGNYILIESRTNLFEQDSRPEQRPNIYLINVSTGLKRLIKTHLYADDKVHFSPGSKYAYWYDAEQKGYFTYAIATGKIQNISAQVPFKLYNEQWSQASKPHAYGLCIWLKNDEGILVYDQYDIWLLDPLGKAEPQNITAGFGRKHGISFRYVYQKYADRSNEAPIKQDSSIIISGFENSTKKNGFFRVTVNKPNTLTELVMQDRFFNYSQEGSWASSINPIFKARDTDVFLLTPMRAEEYPNLSVTTNFSKFLPVTKLQPEDSVNWMTSSLIHWKTYSGTIGTGILYKPTDFNPKNKYPVIIYFYELLSDQLHWYVMPELSTGPMNISWFVSRGYIVLCPDIHYKLGAPGNSIYDYVVSGANYLATRPWVSPGKMGIQAHSFGGFEVNYLITHTSMFAAAVSASGASDLISCAGSLAFANADIHDYYIFHQGRIGTTIWNAPDRYIANSPIFQAHRVKTPLLMMNNKLDAEVPWTQGVEFFTALRYLKKRVWMLQYDNESHEIDDHRDQFDYTTRLTQFFDSLLKGKPEPKWMSAGIPSAQKGRDLGFEFP